MSFESNDDLIRHLQKLGVADGNGRIQAGALVDPTSVVSGTVQNTVYTLATQTLPASFLNRATKGLLVLAFGTTAANANAKNLRIDFGGTNVCIVTGATDSAKDYLLIALVLRTANDTQIVLAQAIVAGALVVASGVIVTAAIDEDAAIAITHKSVNTAAAAASATGKGLVVIELG